MPPQRLVWTVLHPPLTMVQAHGSRWKKDRESKWTRGVPTVARMALSRIQRVQTVAVKAAAK